MVVVASPGYSLKDCFKLFRIFTLKKHKGIQTMKRILFIGLLLSLFIMMNGQGLQPDNPGGRKTTTLNGKWKYIIDPYETGFYDYRYIPYDTYNTDQHGGFFLDQKPLQETDRIEYSFDEAESLWVPGDWNTQDDKLFYYEGSVWYRTTFDYSPDASKRLFIHFGGANYETDVYLNGKKLGRHTGGFTPFAFEITGIVKETGNSLVVKVDNKRKREAVPTLNTDWWNYGGITRDVTLVETPSVFVKNYFIQLEKGTPNMIGGYIQLDGSKGGEKVILEIPDLKVTKEYVTNREGFVAVKIAAKKIEYWSPENPVLYDVTLAAGDDRVTEKIGFRTIETNGQNLLLNGKSIYLRGICMHEENPIRGGRAWSEEDARLFFTWAKELNCNFMRLAHYPHNVNMARLADEYGIMLWEENPVYWTILWDNPETYQNARNQLTELISRDKNRASVIIWSMANETPHSEARNEFIKNLTLHARSMDSTRLISCAMEVQSHPDQPDTKIVKDPLAEYMDVVSFNEYIGWYDGLPEKCSRVTWQIEYNKPVIISEFGGGALQGYHGTRNTRWSEEFQEYLYQESVKMLVQIPQLRGTTPWILCDFRSPKRVLPYIQDGWNRKGLISENGEKKKAFWVMKKFYDEMEKVYK